MSRESNAEGLHPRPETHVGDAKHSSVTPMPVVPRENAERDTDEAIDNYSSENAPESALGFIDALEQAYRHVRGHPDTGESRYAGELNLRGLRGG